MSNYIKLIKHSSKNEVILTILSIISSILEGASKPFMVILIVQVTKDLNTIPQELARNPAEGRNHIDRSGQKISLSFVFLALFCFLFAYLRSLSWAISSEKIVLRIKNLFFYTVMNQNMGWFDSNNSGELVNQITNEVELIKEGYGEKLGELIKCLTCCFLCLAISFTLDVKLSLVMSISIPLIAGSIVGTDLLKNGGCKNATFGIAEEVFSGIKTVIAFQGEGKEHYRYSEKVNEQAQQKNKDSVLSSLGLGFMFLFVFLSFAMGFYYGYHLVVNYSYTPDKVIGVISCAIIGSMSLGSTSVCLVAISKAQVASQSILRVIEQPNLNKESGLVLEKINGNIEFKNVSFTYPSQSQASLKNLTLSIPAGKFVAFVGASGSGKSTIVKLIQRYYEINSGSISLDGASISELNLNEMRNNIGVVGQEPILFNTTIYQNVAYGSSQECSLAKVIEACKLANAHDFIMILPNQYNTIVGDKGSMLSGGQKQRIAIARAIIKSPKILILDEATSALDCTSEKLVQKALDQSSKGKTTIMIAHRLSTIKNADLIYVMNQGQIVEVGSHSELLAKNGAYTELVKAQELKPRTVVNSARSSMINVSMKRKSSKTILSMPSVIIQTKAKKNDLLRLMNYFQAHKTLFFFAMFGASINGSIFPIFSYLLSKVSKILTESKNKDNSEEASLITVSFILLAIMALISQVGKLGLFEALESKIQAKIQSQVYANLLQQEVNFFQTNSVSSLCVRLEQDEAIKLITNPLIMILTTLSSSLFAFYFSFSAGWKLTLVLLACMPLLVVAAWLKNKITNKSIKNNKAGKEKSNQIALEAILNVQTISSLVQEDHFSAKFQAQNRDLLKSTIRDTKIESVFYALSQSLIYIFIAIGFYYGSRLILNEDFKSENMILILFCMAVLSIDIANNLVYLNSMNKHKSAMKSTFELMDRQSTIDENSQGESKELDGEIHFENVTFNYGTNTILKNLDLTLESNSQTALVGPSGSGKSTIINVIQRLDEINSGDVKIDGISIKNWNITELRKQISIVSQEPTLFNYSILENIQYGKSESTFDDVVEAAKLANIHNFIMSLPDQYNTIVGEKGGRLSGGQKQRICIARAMIRKPKLLILDEATSALDSQSEQLVQDALDQVSQGRTCISIAHRLASISHFDQICVLKNGALVEQGSHQELIDNNGVYYQLASQQALT